MRRQQDAVLISLRQAQQFLDANAAVLGVVNQSVRKDLDALVTKLTDLSVAQNSGTRGSKGETSRQHALRLALRRDHMAPIAQVAKYRLPTVPEFSALMLPSVNITAQSQVAAAYAMADAASLHTQTFLDSGLPTTFLDGIRSAAAAVTASLVDRGTHRGRQTGATAGLSSAERQGRALLKVLNALIVSYISTDAQLSRQWTSAIAVQKKPGPAAGSHESSTTPATPAKPAQPAAAPTPATPTLVSTPTATQTIAPSQAPSPAPVSVPISVPVSVPVAA